MKVNPENLINLKADLADAGYCSIIEADKLEYHKEYILDFLMYLFNIDLSLSKFL